MENNKTKKGILAALALLFLVYAASAYATTQGFRESGYAGETAENGKPEYKDYIMAAGEATSSVDANVMIADLNFIGRGKTARQAYGEQQAVMERVIAYLKEKGITETETSSLVITPIYGESKYESEWHSDYSQIASYKVGSTLTIKVRDTRLFDTVLVDATDLGVNEITNVRFMANSSRIAEAKKMVRELALENAKENAAWQAGAINRTLGDMVYVGDPTSDILSQSGYYWDYGTSRQTYNAYAQTAMYLGNGNVEEAESMTPGRITYKANAAIGYLLKDN
jgi:uncharacterized protein YggE